MNRIPLDYKRNDKVVELLQDKQAAPDVYAQWPAPASGRKMHRKSAGDQ